MNDQPALIFIPGWGYAARIWQPTAAALPEYKSRFLEWPQQVDDDALRALATSLPDHAILIGWSLGGILAQELCRIAPNKFRKLILVSSAPRFIATADWPGINQKIADNFLLAAKSQPHEHLQHFHKLVMFPSVNRKNLRFLQQNAQKHPICSMNLSHFLHIDCRKSYNSLELPVLSLAGEHDAVLPPRASDTIIKGAGHAIFLSHPSQFIKMLNDFLDDTNP